VAQDGSVSSQLPQRHFVAQRKCSSSGSSVISTGLVWFGKSLEKLFQQQSQARLLDLLRDKFQNIQRGNSSAEEYLARIKNIADNLAAINNPVNES